MLTTILLAASLGGTPSNDECTGAVLIEAGLTAFTTSSATSSSDLYHDDFCEGTYLGIMNQDVWFRWLPPGDGWLTLSTCGLVDFDTDIVVYIGYCEGMGVLGCNGDAAGCPNYSSEVGVPVEHGYEYLIRVGGYNAGASGAGQLDVTWDGTPALAGACCTDSMCFDGFTQQLCEQVYDGVYGGDGTYCEQVDCVEGACCIAETCEYILVSECEVSGGTYVGGACDQWTCVSEPLGACCITMTGECIGDMTQDDCYSSGGGFWYQEDSCGTVVCEAPPGACCFDDATCAMESAELCAAMGGNWNGSGVQCSDVWCETMYGVCCLGLDCQDAINAADCAAIGGIFMGEGYSCADGLCDVQEVACCIDGTCSGGWTAELCAAQGGVILETCDEPCPCSGDYNGDGTTSIDDMLFVIAGWGDPYIIEDLLAVLDDYGCSGS